MGSFQFGYNLGVINAPESLIKEFMNSTNHARTGSDLRGAALTNLWAITVAIYSAGGCLGGFSAGWWATRFGRRGGCLLNIAIGIVAAVLMFVSKTAKSYEMIIIGRLIVGIHCGLYSGLVPLYLSEMSTPRIRGAVGVLHQLAVVTGLLVSQVLGFPVILGTSSGWNVLLGLAVVPCVIQGVILPFCPESHRYSLLTKGDEEASRNALRQFRGSSNVEDEIEEMKRESAICEKQMSILELLRLPSLRQPLLIGVVMQLSQQFSGINGVRSIPWLIVAELFAHDARPAALSVCVLVNWVSSFIVGYLFPILQSGIKDYVFLPFTVLLALFVTFTFFKVPETKGKTYEEITGLWRSGKSSSDSSATKKENYGLTTNT
ncbi:solute carrier family 2 facilitated glucose transporter member 1 protein [Elysia marginata]|uniref:Solute carrier family 2 facilitated glucose transporter member 1 protein n=1 Tax=Elysia marginata TaxID=1093978 RepID=A0AAV4J801_9GAST|nr:solute carrier family 2 facilitated glucose transporter member 1 protein [Elysia marginata]